MRFQKNKKSFKNILQKNWILRRYFYSQKMCVHIKGVFLNIPPSKTGPMFETSRENIISNGLISFFIVHYIRVVWVFVQYKKLVIYLSFFKVSMCAWVSKMWKYNNINKFPWCWWCFAIINLSSFRMIT